MKELKGHIYHKQRKWTCPQCAKIRMQKHVVFTPDPFFAMAWPVARNPSRTAA
jgi:hypothetical protein